VSKEFSNKRDDCPFPGCQGGCTGCVTVRQDRANKPYYEAANRLLTCQTWLAEEPLLKGMLEDILTVAKYTRAMTKPEWDDRKKAWTK
jgi:hypothetical protein